MPQNGRLCALLGTRPPTSFLAPAFPAAWPAAASRSLNFPLWEDIRASTPALPAASIAGDSAEPAFLSMERKWVPKRPAPWATRP